MQKFDLNLLVLWSHAGDGSLLWSEVWSYLTAAGAAAAQGGLDANEISSDRPNDGSIEAADGVAKTSVATLTNESVWRQSFRFGIDFCAHWLVTQCC